MFKVKVISKGSALSGLVINLPSDKFSEAVQGVLLIGTELSDCGKSVTLELYHNDCPLIRAPFYDGDMERMGVFPEKNEPDFDDELDELDYDDDV